MIVYYNNKPLKIVPKKYKPIIDQIPDLIMDEHRIRLNPEERKSLNLSLLRHFYIEFKKDLKIREPYVFDLIPESSRPNVLNRVTRRDNSVEFHIRLEHDVCLKCKKEDFPGVDFEEDYKW